MPDEVQQSFNYLGYAYLQAVDQEDMRSDLNKILKQFAINF
jgi:hypothetical protein